MKEFQGCFKNRAFDPEKSRGRRNLRPDDDAPCFAVMDPYFLDISKIIHSKALITEHQ